MDQKHTPVSKLSMSRKRPSSRIQCQRQVGSFKLVLAGKGKAALAYHLGVCVRLSETGLLSKFDTILAEDLGCVLAVLLRCHWPELCAEITNENKFGASQSYRYLPAPSVPSTLFETSEQHKDVARMVKQRQNDVVSMRASVAASLTELPGTTASTVDTPTTQSPSINGQTEYKLPPLPVPPTTSSVHKSENKSAFTRRITEPLMDFILNVDMRTPSTGFTDWMTRNSVAFDLFVDDDISRCSVRLLCGAPWRLRQIQPGTQNTDFIDILPALLWGTKLKQACGVREFSSIWHAMLAHVGPQQRQVTFLTSLADVSYERKAFALFPPGSASQMQPELMQPGCCCIHETGDVHIHVLKDLMRQDAVQQHAVIVETLQSCLTEGLKISTTVSPLNRVSVSPGPPTTPQLRPQTNDTVPSHVSLPPSLQPKPSSSSGESDSGSASPTPKAALQQRLPSMPSQTSRRGNDVSLEWSTSVHVKIENAILDATLRSTVPLSISGSCMNWGYRQAAVYIHKMLQQSPKLCSLGINDRQVVFPVPMLATIRTLQSQTLPVDNNRAPSTRTKSTSFCCWH